MTAVTTEEMQRSHRASRCAASKECRRWTSRNRLRKRTVPIAERPRWAGTTSSWISTMLWRRCWYAFDLQHVSKRVKQQSGAKNGSRKSRQSSLWIAITIQNSAHDNFISIPRPEKEKTMRSHLHTIHCFTDELRRARWLLSQQLMWAKVLGCI